MNFFRQLIHWGRDVPIEGHHAPTRDASVDVPIVGVRLQVEKCPIPIVWLDTSLVLNLAKLRLGILNDTVQENRLNRLRRCVCDLTRKGKLLCPKAGQVDEVWARRADFLDALHELSLDVTTRPKAAIEETQIQRLMSAYIARARSVTFPYTDAFIDDPLPRFAQMLTRDYFVTVDSGLLGTIEQIQSRRDTIHDEWEDLRKRCIRQGSTFEQQLQRERLGALDATMSMARDCVLKVERGEEPTENERWALSGMGRLRNTWDRLGGEPKGLEGLLMFFNSPYYTLVPSSDISSNLVAHLMVGDRKIAHGDAMDTEHISSMLPYANLMILDKSMRNIVQGLGLDKKYYTTICYVGDDEVIAGFFEAVEKSPASVSPFPPFFINGKTEEKPMTSRTAFHLDCTPVIPECGFNCGKCIEEMQSVFDGTQGVSKFYREGDGVVVEHDAGVIAVEQLLDIFRGLPSFYAGRFIPTVPEKTEAQGG